MDFVLGVIVGTVIIGVPLGIVLAALCKSASTYSRKGEFEDEN